MADQFAIHDATSDDIADILALHRQLSEDDPGLQPIDEATARAALSLLITNPSIGRLFIARDGATIVGYLLLAISFSLEFGGRVAFIDELIVDRACRGRGCGNALLARAEEHAQAAGCGAIHLEVSHGNDRAAILYQRRGYRSLGRRLMTRRL